MTRAERYKRNYHLVRNKYFDHKLAQKARSWSDETLYKKLGIRPTKTTPELKEITPRAITRGQRKLLKFQLGIDEGLTPREANRVTNYKNSKIKATAEWLRAKTRKQKMDLWSKWSRHSDPFPPDIERGARERNRGFIMANGKPLDDYAKYGYMYEFFMFVEGRPADEVADLIEQSPHDEYRITSDPILVTAR